MFKNYIITAYRNIIAEKKYSIINIVGLSLGITACILILLWVSDELSYDRQNENYSRIYRAIREGRAHTPSPLGPKLQQDLPEVDAATRIIKDDEVLISANNQNFLENDFIWADPEIFDVFTIPLINGMANLNDPNNILLSESMAKKYFPDGNAINKIIEVGEKNSFIIAGVFKDLPVNVHMNINFLVPYETYFRIMNNDINNWFANFSYTYFLLKEGVDPLQLENKIGDVIDIQMINSLPEKILNTLQKPYPRIFYVQPLSEIHLHSHLLQEIGTNGDIKYIYLFASIAILILLIACINYINLETAKAGKRSKEVGIRKVAGAERKQLIYQFFGESLVITFVSMLLSLIIVRIAIPFFNQMTGRSLDFHFMASLKYLVLFVGMTVGISFFAGFYPAINLSGFQPICVLKGNFFRSNKGKNLRKLLVIAQFTITIFLIVTTLIIDKQIRFLQNSDPGYERDQIITVPIRDRKIHQTIDALKSELEQLSGVKMVSASALLPNNITTFTTAEWIGKPPDKDFTINYNTVDENYIDLFGIEIIEGRNFSKEHASDRNGVFLLNEAALKAAGFTEPMSEIFLHWNDKSGPVVGVMKDFNFRSMHHPIEPLYLYYSPKDFSNISIKISTMDYIKLIKEITEVFEKFSPAYPFEYSFFDESFTNTYREEHQLQKLFSSFAVLAIFIACMGLFGLVLFSTERRKKEFSVRRVLGSSVSGIFFIAIEEFFKWIVIANLIAWPIAYFYANNWLQNFAYRAQFTFWPFLTATFLTFLIAGVTMSLQLIKTIRSNPVDALKYE